MNTLLKIVGFSIPLWVGAAVGLFAYYLLPIIDERIKDRTGGYLDWIVLHLDRMFIKSDRRNALLMIITSTSITTFFAFILTFGSGFLNFVITISAAYIGWTLPRLIILLRWKQRLAKFDLQLTDALTLMANSIKSGLNLLQVIQVVSKEMPNPVAQEFQLVLNQHHLGVPIDDALQNMANRIPTEDVNMAVSAILILRETGGDLSETFDTIATTVRERRKVEGKIKAVTAQGITQASILIFIPLAVGLIFYVVNPEYVGPLVHTGIGRILIVCMLALQTIGGLWMKKIVTIDL